MGYNYPKMRRVPKKDVYQFNELHKKKHVELVGVQQAGIGPYIIPGRLLSEQRVWDTERGPVHWLLIFPIKHWQPLGLLREKPHFQRPMRELLVDDGCPNSRLTWVYACIYSWMGLYTPTNITRQPLRTADCEKSWKSWQDRIAQAEQTDDHSRGGPKVSARKLPQFDPQSFRSISTYRMLGPRELQVWFLFGRVLCTTKTPRFGLVILVKDVLFGFLDPWRNHPRDALPAFLCLR